MSKESKILLVIIGLVTVFAFTVFLFTRDGYGNGPTGAEVVFHQGAGYLMSMAIFTVIAIAAVIYGVRSYSKTQNTSKLIAPGIVAVIALSIAFGKGCTDKANGGVTGPKGAPIAVVKG